MKKESVFWTDYSVLICTKCQKSMVQATTETEDIPNFAESIKDKYKSELNSLGYKGKVRVMTSSCLGVCPKGFQAVSLVSTTDPLKNLSYVFDPLKETELVLEELKKSIVL